MKKSYFELDEDFETIIKNALPKEEIISTNNITTGWTNIVYEVETGSRKLFFSFSKR